MEMLNTHTWAILEEYRKAIPLLSELKKIVYDSLNDTIKRNGIFITAVETRIKNEESLCGKLNLKGGKYNTLFDITDILGARIITYYTDDVDRIAAMVEQMFDVDWNNSVDKRRLHQLDSFGYNSLHYICRLPGSTYHSEQFPEINEIPFEVQIRTTLQHAWAAINHDIGYKSGVEIPQEYLRQMNRLAGMLEMADDEFSRIRTEINAYRRRVQQLVATGKLDDVRLDGDTFRSYLQTRPLEALNKRIAAINQAEIHEISIMNYLPVLKALGCVTLGDVSRFLKQYEEDAYRLARHQLGVTDLDIISSTLGLQNICIACIIRQGGGKIGLRRLFDVINGKTPRNVALADTVYEHSKDLLSVQ